MDGWMGFTAEQEAERVGCNLKEVLSSARGLTGFICSVNKIKLSATTDLVIGDHGCHIATLSTGSFS